MVLFLVAALFETEALADVDSFAPPLTPSQVQGLISTAQTTAMTSTTVPASGPGAGLCKETIVPGPSVSSGGVTGTTGTCAAIIQCGTSSAYVVKQLNVGSGC